MADKLDFSGKVVVVTGGGKGVGRGISQCFLAAGAELIICGRSRPDQLPSVDGREAVFVEADVRDPDASAAVIEAAVDSHGRLDVLVNNAGGAPATEAATASPRFSESIVRLNLLAALNCAQQANVVMQQQDGGGAIINISSVSALRPSPGTAAYGAAKAGLLSLTESLAVEWAPRVRVNAVIGIETIINLVVAGLRPVTPNRWTQGDRMLQIPGLWDGSDTASIGNGVVEFTRFVGSTRVIGMGPKASAIASAIVQVTLGSGVCGIATINDG